MADSLSLSGPGTVTVVTEALDGKAAVTRRAAGLAETVASGARALAAEPPVLSGDLSALDAARSVAIAAAEAERLAVRLQGLADALVQAADAYGEADRAAARRTELMLSVLAHSVGHGLRASLVVAQAAGALAPAWLRAVPGLLPLLARSTEGRAMLDRVIAAALADPVTSDSVRALVEYSPELLAGAGGVPLPVTLAAGESGVGLVDEQLVALLVLAAANLAGLARETPVVVRRTALMRSSPPDSLAGLLERIPQGEPGTPQVRVERWTAPDGRSHAAVYLDGTSLEPDQPFDMTSNLNAKADRLAGSIRAAEEAMRRAGVGPDDPVVFVGYSQGGLVASMIAESGRWECAGVVTAGSPGADTPIPAGAPVVAFEHEEDYVPALSGMHGGGASHPLSLTVRRTVLDGRAVEGDLMPAHHLPDYVATAALADADGRRETAAARAAVLAHFAGTGAGAVQSTLWRADRVSAAVSDGDRRAAAARGRSAS